MSNQNNFEVHRDNRQFLSAIEYTAAQTGFQPELIEKDYYCSLILNDLAMQDQEALIFKGGTLLAKSHAGFYRLSEDLDFTISVSKTASRKERSQLVANIKSLVNSLPDRLVNLIVEKKLTGSDESRQYNAEVNYKSCLSQRQGRILVDIGLREKIQHAAAKKKMNTLLLNPFTHKKYITEFYFLSLSLQEAYAEKMRAALTRKKVAIRDFYDLDYAIKNNILNIDNLDFIDLVKVKLLVQNTKVIGFDQDKLDLLKNKVPTELMPTLNQSQKINFDLNDIISDLNVFIQKYLIIGEAGGDKKAHD